MTTDNQLVKLLNDHKGQTVADKLRNEIKSLKRQIDTTDKAIDVLIALDLFTLDQWQKAYSFAEDYGGIE